MGLVDRPLSELPGCGLPGISTGCAGVAADLAESTELRRCGRIFRWKFTEKPGRRRFHGAIKIRATFQRFPRHRLDFVLDQPSEAE